MAFFDPRSIERESTISGNVLPDGVHTVIIDKAEERHKDGKTGVMLYLKPTANSSCSVVTDYLCIDHHNEDTQRIGRQKFVTLLDCVDLGKKPLRSPSELEGKHVKVVVGSKPHWKYEGQLQNTVKKYLPLSLADQAEVDNQLKVDYNDDSSIPF